MRKLFDKTPRRGLSGVEKRRVRQNERKNTITSIVLKKECRTIICNKHNIVQEIGSNKHNYKLIIDKMDILKNWKL